MGLHELLLNSNASWWLSVIWGFGVAVIFYNSCKTPGCIVVTAPPMYQVAGRTFGGGGGSCWRFTQEYVQCCDVNEKTCKDSLVRSQ